MAFDREAAAALAAVREASRLCRRVQARRVPGAALVKGDRSPVTVADFGAQALVCRRLASELPGDEVMGEEDSTELRTPRLAAVAEEVRGEVAADVPGATLDEVLGWIDRARSGGGPGRVWALDPIDGTKGYLRGQQYAIALALLVGGTVQVAALACPNLTRGSHTGCVLLAARGAGANLYPLEAGAPELVRASDVDDPRRARVLESVESAHGDQERHERLRGLLGVAEPIVRLDSQAKYAVLARGEAEIYLRLPTRRDYHENVWDHAAGTLVLEEAGGRVSDAFGRPLDFGAGRRLERNRGVVATNGRLHERVIAALRDLVGERP